MQKRLILVLTISIAMGASQTIAQAVEQSTVPPSSDPYRNFLGDWHGEATEIPVDNNNPPSSVTLHIVEEKRGNRMRWDYVFGKAGEKGYSRETKWVEFKAAKELLILQWQGGDKERYTTSGLDRFADKGFGSFIGELKQDGNRTFSFTLALDETTLAYHRERLIGKASMVYSRFNFVRYGVQQKTASADEINSKQQQLENK